MSPTPIDLDSHFSPSHQQQITNQLMGRIGLTRRRAECFVRLWGYLMLKQANQGQPITQLVPLAGVACTCREAAELFYMDSERGSDRAAGMMLDKLVGLGLLKKSFNGNTLELTVPPVPELSAQATPAPITFAIDTFDPRCDAVPVATLLAANYDWLNHNEPQAPYYIAQQLRAWATEYVKGMRVLRRCDTLSPVAFYLFYPTHPESEVKFFSPPNKTLHLGLLSGADDAFMMATPGDENCRALFVRSWVMASDYREQQIQPLLLNDAQNTLRTLIEDFPELCDIYSLTMHPSYEQITQWLGFQPLSTDPQSSISWLYLAVDRFLQIQTVA